MKRLSLILLFLGVIMACKSPVIVGESYIEKEGENPIFYRFTIDKKMLVKNPLGNPFESTKGSIVFVHAGGLDQEMWAKQRSFFGQKYEVFTYDIRGHGRSLSKVDTALEIDDLKAFLEELIFDKVHLVGCSLGAIISLDFVLAYPEYVDKLVLVSPGLIGVQEKSPDFLAMMTQYVGAIQQGKQEEMLHCLKKLNALGQNERQLAPEIDEYVTTQLEGFIESGNYLRVPQLKEVAPASRLGEIKSKTLILYGEEDFDYIKTNAQALHEGIPQSKLKSFDEAAHLINLEQPEQFNRKLKAFLR